MDNFTPLSALLGGLLIGCATALLWLANGRIAGISGIIGSLPTARGVDLSWRIAFLAGLIGAPMLLRAPPVVLDAKTPAIVIGGLLVGFGTRLGGGCTSGHGVCGLARLSPRSLIATAGFMAAGFLTVYVTRHLLAV